MFIIIMTEQSSEIRQCHFLIQNAMVMPTTAGLKLDPAFLPLLRLQLHYESVTRSLLLTQDMGYTMCTYKL
jgi:hypothetical protein